MFTWQHLGLLTQINLMIIFHLVTEAITLYCPLNVKAYSQIALLILRVFLITTLQSRNFFSNLAYQSSPSKHLSLPTLF